MAVKKEVPVQVPVHTTVEKRHNIELCAYAMSSTEIGSGPVLACQYERFAPTSRGYGPTRRRYAASGTNAAYGGTEQVVREKPVEIIKVRHVCITCAIYRGHVC
eukprot:2151244-Rhodomonas_salina.1